MKNKTNLSKRGGTLSGQIKKNKRTYWVSLGRLKKGLDSHRRKVSLYGAEKLLHNIHPKWRRLSRWEAYTIQVYNTEKPCKRTCTGLVQRKVQMNNQSQASSQTSSGTVFIVQCIFLLSHCELMKSGFITMALIPPNAFFVCRTLNWSSKFSTLIFSCGAMCRGVSRIFS